MSFGRLSKGWLSLESLGHACRPRGSKIKIAYNQKCGPKRPKGWITTSFRPVKNAARAPSVNNGWKQRAEVRHHISAGSTAGQRKNRKKAPSPIALSEASVPAVLGYSNPRQLRNQCRLLGRRNWVQPTNQPTIKFSIQLN